MPTAILYMFYQLLYVPYLPAGVQCCFYSHPRPFPLLAGDSTEMLMSVCDSLQLIITADVSTVASKFEKTYFYEVNLTVAYQDTEKYFLDKSSEKIPNARKIFQC